MSRAGIARTRVSISATGDSGQCYRGPHGAPARAPVNADGWRGSSNVARSCGTAAGSRRTMWRVAVLQPLAPGQPEPAGRAAIRTASARPACDRRSDRARHSGGRPVDGGRGGAVAATVRDVESRTAPPAEARRGGDLRSSVIRVAPVAESRPATAGRLPPGIDVRGFVEQPRRVAGRGGDRRRRSRC